MSISTDATIDLTDCDREPIHIPGTIQSYGLILAVRDDVVIQISANWPVAEGEKPQDLLGRPLTSVVRGDRSVFQTLVDPLLVKNPVLIGELLIGSSPEPYRVIAHRFQGVLILELKRSAATWPSPFGQWQSSATQFMNRAQETKSVEEACHMAAVDIRRLSGFDRTLVYQFDHQWSGYVVAEDLNDQLPSYLHLRFPATDIPKQARELYRLNRVRLIPDANYIPVPLLSRESQPLDLTYAFLRAVSPVHLEYMRNMGTAASLSIAIIVDGNLWGLIVCHHKTPRWVPYEIRSACDFLSQALSLQISSRRHADASAKRLLRAGLRTDLLKAMAPANHFVDAILERSTDLLGLTSSLGAALFFEDRCTLIGRTPDESQVRALVTWLAARPVFDLFHTSQLSKDYPDALAYKSVASGLLAVSISKIRSGYLLWFRPELVQTVRWGGNPSKPTEPAAGTTRIQPRVSFESWKETVRDRAQAWEPDVLEAAGEFRNAIVGLVLRRAEEMAKLTDELRESNKELEAFSYTVSHDLRAPFRHIVGYADLIQDLDGDKLSARGKEYLANVLEAAKFAGRLVDDLLKFSRVGRSEFSPERVDMTDLVRSARQDEPVHPTRRVDWSIGPLPRVYGDPILLRSVWSNLISNALKYSRGRTVTTIAISAEESPEFWTFSIRDNGVGFDMKYVDKLFGVFQRLHRMEDFEGTGIGLATARRIIMRHGGRIWATSGVEQGATFYFALPKTLPSAETADA